MRISVIIPTYNSGPLVVEAVESALAQTLPPHEIIVVDDGSTDDTSERLRPYLGRICYVRQPNARVAAARNTGLRHSSGDAVAFLDADDAWHPSKLERQACVLAAHPHIGLLATDVTPWPGNFPPNGSIPASGVELVPLERLLLFNPLATSSIVVRRSVLRQAGEFDTELFGPEDYDLWLRCARFAAAAVLPEPLTGYRDTSGSLGKQAETMRRGLLRIHGKLEAAGMWKDRRWLKRKSRARIEFATAFMYYAAGNRATAVLLLLQSLAIYPWLMSPPDVRFRWARVRLLARSMLMECRLPNADAAEQSRSGVASTV